MREVQLSNGLAVWVRLLSGVNVLVVLGLGIWMLLMGQWLAALLATAGASWLAAVIARRVWPLREAWMTGEGIRVVGGGENRVIPYTAVVTVGYTGWSPWLFLQNRAEVVVDSRVDSIETLLFMPMWGERLADGRPAILAELDARVVGAHLASGSAPANTTLNRRPEPVAQVPQSS
jgi:hypothetical protein